MHLLHGFYKYIDKSVVGRRLRRGAGDQEAEKQVD